MIAEKSREIETLETAINDGEFTAQLAMFHQEPEKYTKMLSAPQLRELLSDMQHAVSVVQSRLIDNLSSALDAAKETMTCQICMDKQKEVVFVPCGHQTCNQCVIKQEIQAKAEARGKKAKQQAKPLCPYCRKMISSRQEFCFGQC